MVQSKRKTVQARMYRDTRDQLKLKFGEVRMADLIDIVIKTNPSIQLEAMLRDMDKKFFGNGKNKK